MNIYKKFVLLVLLAPLPFICFLFALLYVYDPVMLYHKPYFRKETFHEDMRLQDKAIIDHYDFNSIILGSSMLQNTSAKEANEKLGGKWVNLSFAGGNAIERAVVLNYAFKKKKIANIIYSLDSFLGDEREFPNNFNKIYELDDFFTPLGIYINPTKPKFILCALTYSTKKKCVGVEGLENATRWDTDEKTMAKFGGIEHWNIDKKEYLEILNAPQIEFNPSKNIDITNIKLNLQESLLNLIKENLNTNFHFIIPPYSRLLYRVAGEESRSYYNKNFTLFSKYKELVKWLLVELEKYPNARIYGFDNLSYADDIKNYKDYTHYNADMNSMHLDAIKNQTHILTKENVDEYFDTMEAKIRAYDLKPIVETIDKTFSKKYSK